MVEIGQIIVSSGEKYEVSQIWPAGASTVIDFIAKQLKKCGTDIEGNPVYAGRGFSYAVKNWELEERQMTNEQKLELLNTIEVIDSSSCAGELEYVCINSRTKNKEKLRMLGVTDDEMDSYTDRSDGTIDVVPFISNYVEYEWFQESLGGFMKHRPLDADEAQMELIEASYPEEKTYKEILLSYGLDIEVIGRWTEEQCKAECDDINREGMTKELIEAEGDWPDPMEVMDEF